MARIWVEPYQGHSVPFEYWDEDAQLSNDPLLGPKPVMFVSVASFTFHFVSARQIEDCLAYYELEGHKSSRLPVGGMDHWEAQRWFERLPMYLLEAPKQTKVVKALKRALTMAESGAFV